MPENPWDTAISRLGPDSQMQSRFTRTPIDVNNVAEFFRKVQEQFPESKLTGPAKFETTGQYSPEENRINLTIGKEKDPYKAFQNALHHEDIHSVLGLNPGRMPQSSIFNEAPDRVNNAWNKSSRAGIKNFELPAYMGAFNGRDVPVSPEDRMKWMSMFISMKDPKVAELLKRMMSSNDSSQRPQTQNNGLRLLMSGK